MLSKVGRLKPIKKIITRVPNLTLVNLTNITSYILENITDTLTSTPIMETIEKTISNVTQTITLEGTIYNVTKTSTIETDSSIDTLTLIIRSKIFTIILLIMTFFIGFGWIFRIIYNK